MSSLPLYDVGSWVSGVLCPQHFMILFAFRAVIFVTHSAVMSMGHSADGELIQDVPPGNRGLRFVVSVLSCALSSFWVKPDSFTIPGCPHPIFSEHLSRFLPLLAEPGNSTLSEEKKKKGKKNSKASEMQSLSDSSRCAP